MITDVIIIGGGAAGLCTAVYLKKKNPRLSIRLLESGTRVGKKLSLTGNGRCNITNSNIELSRYHGRDVEFCRYALEKYNLAYCKTFFKEIGVPFTFEGDKGFPASLQASSVVDCLRFSADNLGVITHLETKVTNIMLSNGNYKVIAEKMSFLAKNIIIATGLYSGGERLGCNGEMLEILKKAGYKTVFTTPAIVQLKTETDIVKQLKGIKVNALATLKLGKNVYRKEYGEVLFCDYGLSGPPILQLSRETARTKGECSISLDILPQIDINELSNYLEERKEDLSNLRLEEFFTGMLNKRLGQIIVKLCGLKLGDNISRLTKADTEKLAYTIKNLNFNVTGNTGFINSQVTAGGLSTSQFNPKTMMSNLNKGLYAVGEILDIDGDCGGFNLQWAWSSSMCAAESVLEGGNR